MSLPTQATRLVAKPAARSIKDSLPKRPIHAFADALRRGEKRELVTPHEALPQAPRREKEEGSRSVEAPKPDEQTEDVEVATDPDRLGDAAASLEAPGLDPLERALWEPMASRAVPAMAPTSPAAPHHAPAMPAVDALVDRFLKRFAMSGDRHRGTAALQIGSGALAGSAVTVHAEGRDVRIVVDAPAGPELDQLTARLRGRLEAKGLSVSVELASA